MLAAISGGLYLLDADTLEFLAPIEGVSMSARGQLGIVTPDWLLFPGNNGLLVTRLAALGPAPSISAQGIVNGATGQSGAIAAGEIVSLFGSNLGPDPGAGPSLETHISLSTEVEHTQVRFDGLPAAILFTGGGQINAVVPEGVRDNGQILVQVFRNSVPSPKVFVDAAPYRPGLFSYVAGGKPYAAATDDAGRLQGPKAPLARGKPATFYGTGVGLAPGLAANAVAVRPAALAATPSMTIGGRPVEVTYAGAAPGLTAGVAQLNVIIPKDAPPGDAIEAIVTVGGRSQGGVWVAIQ
jgi:uncharacterized protein (TIGR03437 family)